MDTLRVAFIRNVGICWLVFAISSAPQAVADDNQLATNYAINIRSCDEIWIVSTRQLDPSNFTPQQLCVQQLCAGRWEPRSIQHLIQAHQIQNEKPLVMYVHGSRLDFYWARRRGLETYQDLTVACTAAPPIRFVTWAWPSEDHDHMVINYPRILRRSVREGNALGWFLAAAGEGHRIGVLAYSLGVQVLGIAGEVACRQYSANDCCHAVAIGSVTCCCWPETVDQAHAVLAAVGNMLVVDNQQDHAACAYRKGCKLRRPNSPLGLDWLEQYDCANKMQRFDVTSVVKEEHQIHEYMKHPCIARRVLDQLVDRESHGETDLIQEVDSTIAGYNIFEHHEPGHPAGNPPRKLLNNK